ncbi:MAG: type II secretion system protein GspE, partial [Candidatus Magnetoovum sp. WYHC-5]|nr:type II secretion system protein GspE [Candidatus Magnetoovum sp. WYHC-5]
DMGVESFLLASTLRGILAQRLVRVICQSCRVVDEEGATDEELRMIGLSPDTVLYKGRGCERCTGTGFYGRNGIYELLVIEETIRKNMLTNTDSSELRKLARLHGMHTLLESGAHKVELGITTIPEVLRVTQEV